MKMMFQIITAVIRQIGQVNMTLISAGVAFYSMLAMFPALAALISLWGLFSDPDVVLEELQLLQDIMPDSVFNIVEAQVIALSSNTTTLTWTSVISLGLALWSSRSGVAGMILGLNLIHGSNRRGSVLHYLFAIVITVALIGVGIIALASVVIIPLILSFVPLHGLSALLVQAAQWGAALGAIFVGLTLIYRYGPNQKGNDRDGWLTWGAVLVASLWGLVSFGFSVYLANFSNYNQVYGSLGAAVAMLLWLYVSAFLALLGGSLNVQIKRRRMLDNAMEGLP